MDKSNTDVAVRLASSVDTTKKKADEVPTAAESRRREFQGFLDRSFPIGAMCAVIGGEYGLEDASPSATGRLVCSEVGETQGRRWHEIVIDPVGAGVAIDVAPIRVRVGMPIRHHSNTDLWEAAIFDENPDCILRMNANPSASFRPTAVMRTAVAERYADLLPKTAWPA